MGPCFVSGRPDPVGRLKRPGPLASGPASVQVERVSEGAAQRLKERGIRPSVQRVAIAEIVLSTHRHPSADEVWAQVKERYPMISRATVYNTLNLLVDEGLLRSFVSTEGRTVFDPNTQPHHHLVDDATGQIHDVPWEALSVRGVDELEGFEVRDVQVVLHGRAKRRRSRR